jgi:hypothetical protein
MRSRSFRIAAVLALVTAALGAWQSNLLSAGFGQSEQNQIIKAFFSSKSGDVTSLLGWISGPARTAMRGRDAAWRVTLVREAAGVVKRTVQAPGFQKIHDAWIKESLNAVNHGIRVEPQAPEAQPNMESIQNQTAAAIAQSMQGIPAEHLGPILDSEIDSLKDSDDAEDRQKLARVRQIKTLLASRPAEAKSQYIRYMVAKVGGPSDEAGLQAAVQDANKAKADAERREQQLNYNKYNLKAQLRERLGAFIAEVKTVDFGAQTREQSGKRVFVNPAYEQKSGAWKVMYRIGREPSLAALEIAEQWRREL